MLTYSQRDATAVVAAARHIEQHGPPAAQLAARMLAVVLGFIPAHQRRAVALGIAEIALRDARATRAIPSNETRSPVQ
jgi:hypothetical protein